MSKITILFEHSDKFILNEVKEGRSASKIEEKAVDLSELSSEERALLSEVVNVCGNDNRDIYFTFKGLYGIYRQDSNNIHEVLKAYAEGKAKSEELDRVREEEARKRKEEEESRKAFEDSCLKSFGYAVPTFGSEIVGVTDFTVRCKTATGSVIIAKNDISRNIEKALESVRNAVNKSNAVVSFIYNHGSDYLKGLFENGFEYSGRLYDEVRDYYRPEGYDLPEDYIKENDTYIGLLSESSLNRFLEESKETESKGYGKPTLSCYDNGDMEGLYLKVSLETKESGNITYGKVLIP